MTQDDQRKFLHDFATPLSILKLHTRRLIKMATLTPDDPNSKMQMKLLTQMTKALESMEELHAEFKSKIHEKSAA